ncbi:MAG: hypothetical protein KC731_26835 [Myxococcales bacterium]|nr:hypothetical protein [Myxococcales bacterium]
MLTIGGQRMHLGQRAARSSDVAFLEEICDILFEIGQYRFPLENAFIEAEPDAARRAVYTGLLMLHDELQFQNEQRGAVEAQLRHREARTRALIDLAKVAIWDCSIEGVRAALAKTSLKSNGRPFEAGAVSDVTRRLRVQGINREGLRMLGAATVGEVEARLGELAMSDDGMLFGALWRGLNAGQRVVEVEGVLTTLSGASIRVLVGLSLPHDEVDEDVAILTFADITAHHARVEAEQEARRRAEELARVNVEVERLFYAVAHDLRSPLRAVETLAEWIMEDIAVGDVEDVKSHVVTLKGRVGRLDRMLNDLLSYARVGRTQHAKERVEVGALLEEIEGGLLPIPEGFELVWSTMPTLYVERTLLLQVLLNLIGNALKHHDAPRGRIEITCTAEPGRHVFRVTDDGPGIPIHYRDRIFGLFSTLKRRDEVEGSGMGLAFVQKVVQRVGGRVVAEGPEGRGITFRVDWPK